MSEEREHPSYEAPQIEERVRLDAPLIGFDSGPTGI
jgi:hypothetical protein